MGSSFNFLDELFWILFKLWGCILFLPEAPEGCLRGVWLKAFFPVRLRPLVLIADPFNYLAGSLVGVFNCLLAVYCTFSRLSMSLCIWRGLFSIFVGFLMIWDLLIVSLGLTDLCVLFSTCASGWCIGVLVDFNDTRAVQFSFPSWKQMLFLIRNYIN